MTKQINLSGPHYVCHVRDNVTDKQIYLFGEVHKECNNKNNMIKIAHYLDNIFKTYPNKTFDYFIEASYYRDKHYSKPDGKSSIHDSMEYFSPYFNEIVNKPKVRQWPNVRFHDIDIRNYMHDQKLSNDETDDYTILTSLFHTIFRTKEIKLNHLQLNCIKKHIYNQITNKLYDLDVLLNNRWKIIMQNPKLKRNVEHIYTNLKEHYQDELSSFLRERINGIKRFDIIGRVFKNIVECEKVEDKGLNILIIYSFFTKYSIIFMDAYLLGRMYKTFIPKNNLDIKKTTANNIIVLTGSKHTENLKKYFQKTNCQIIYEHKNEAGNFVKMKTELFT